MCMLGHGMKANMAPERASLELLEVTMPNSAIGSHKRSREAGCTAAISAILLLASLTLGGSYYYFALRDAYGMNAGSCFDETGDRRMLQAGRREVFSQPRNYTVPWTDVNTVIDGDTVCVSTPAWGERTRLRLACIDAPEVGHLREIGKIDAARDALQAQLQLTDSFMVVQLGVDGTGSRRPLVDLRTRDRSINLWLVQQGYAEFVCRGGCPECDAAKYERAERDARRAGRWMWTFTNSSAS